MALANCQVEYGPLGMLRHATIWGRPLEFLKDFCYKPNQTGPNISQMIAFLELTFLKNKFLNAPTTTTTTTTTTIPQKTTTTTTTTTTSPLSPPSPLQRGVWPLIVTSYLNGPVQTGLLKVNALLLGGWCVCVCVCVCVCSK